MSRILFSPVGGSDPIRNYRDGSLLHICRHYLPDKVYLYLSFEMYENHKRDNRYLYCLDELGKMCGHSFRTELIIREDLKDVQDHEIFYQDFITCITDIRKTMLPEDELYVNISSGTPAMKNALVVLSTLAEVPFQAIQVTTPLKSSNRMDENMQEYEVEAQWECNEDNLPDIPSRCQVVKSVNLASLLKANIVKKHLLAYDYTAAYQVAEGMKEQLSPECLLYLEQAKARAELNAYRVNEIAGKIGYQPMPVRSEGERIVVEYLLSLQIKKLRGNYDDFVRAITPPIVALMERALKKQCHTDIDTYCIEWNGVRKWDKNKLKGSEAERILQDRYQGQFNYNGPVYSVHIKDLILALSKNQKLNLLIEELRIVEEKVRNRAAHTMTPVTEDMIEKWTRLTETDAKGFVSADNQYLTNRKRKGLLPGEIMEKIKKLAEFIGIAPEDEIWNSYDSMNQKIIRVLDSSLSLN